VTGACLIVDDSPLVRESLRRVLVRGGLFEEVLVASDGAEALELLGRNGERRIDLVLCDLVMPEVDGFDLLERIVGDPALEDLPVIVLTGKDEVDTKVDALEAGAADYLTKPCHDSELLARVKVHHKMKLLRDELREANERLRELAIRDPLTGLFNRRHWRHLMLMELERCRRHERPIAVLMVDIDHFKTVNDRFGHVVGDRVLAAVARRLEGELRAHDSIARLGGEEFAVLLPETGIRDARTAAERLRLAVRDVALPEADGLEVRVSVGAAAASALTDDEIDVLMAAADEALYQAKRGGRNRTFAASELAGSAAP
jgi:diguanylate cyclase (GGDEF)-like protein